MFGCFLYFAFGHLLPLSLINNFGGWELPEYEVEVLGSFSETLWEAQG